MRLHTVAARLVQNVARVAAAPTLATNLKIQKSLQMDSRVIKAARSAQMSIFLLNDPAEKLSNARDLHIGDVTRKIYAMRRRNAGEKVEEFGGSAQILHNNYAA